MANTSRDTPEGYLTMAQARARLGVSKVTMARIVRSSSVRTYEDPRDARVKLLRVEDVDRLAQPRPASDDQASKRAA